MTNRELDALVAEKVMGWMKTPGKVEQVWVRPGGPVPFEDVYKVQPPNYSTDIAPAWEVVEKLIAYNPFWEENNCLQFLLTPTAPKGWCCNFGDDNTLAYGDAASHAICLAALKVLLFKSPKASDRTSKGN